MAKLTLKQQRFADEYIISGNAEQAALKAGYSKSYSRARASDLLANVGIKSHIDVRLKELMSEKIANQQEVMEFLTAIMRGEVTEPVAIFTGDGCQDVVELKPNVTARKAAAELIGKRYAMWTDKQEITGDVAVTFIDDIGSDLDEA